MGMILKSRLFLQRFLQFKFQTVAKTDD
jgi:hypothetical protein